MSIRAPFTLWRFILLELTRLVLIVACVLVTVITFALTIKFFADGVLGPLETLRFMAFAAVPMLQYALPFAAGFAATLTYHRLASDNELTGARAGGMSHRTILAPALALGLALSLALSSLSELVIPRFLLSMESLVGQSVAKLIVNSIRQRQPIENDNYRIYADDVRIVEVEGGIADRELVLLGVAIIEVDDEGAVRAEAFSQMAQVALVPGVDVDEGGIPRDVTRIHIRLHDAVARGKDGWFRVNPANHTISVPSSFDDDPKFLTFRELRQAYHSPDRLSPVNDRRISLAVHEAIRRSIEIAQQSLSQTRRFVMVVEGGPTLVIHAGSLRHTEEMFRWELAPAPGADRIKIDQFSESGGRLEITAMHAVLTADVGSDLKTRKLDFKLDLTDVTTRTEGGGGGAPEEVEIKSLRVRESPLAELITMPSEDLLEVVEPRLAGPNPDGLVANPARILRDRIQRIRREITSKRHERLAMSAACLVMVLAGAVSAIRLKDKLPLRVYLWSFFPSLLTLLTISGGQQMVEQSGAPGLFLLWGGVGAFSIYTLITFLCLRRR